MTNPAFIARCRLGWLSLPLVILLVTGCGFVYVKRDGIRKRVVVLLEIRTPDVSADYTFPAEWIDRAIVSTGNNARLKAVFDKAGRGEEIILGFIGGSITQGLDASSPQARYAGYVQRWFASVFPLASVRVVNAGINATGSDYGAARASRDLLAKNPDLVVVEFAVNDADTREAAASYEGLIRQILASPPRPAVILLFMCNRWGNNAQAWESRIGEHYGLPAVSYKNLIGPALDAGQLTWLEVSGDSVHPNDRGHAFAGKLLQILLQRERDRHPVETALGMPAPLVSDLFEHCALSEADVLTPVVNQGWRLEKDPALGLGKSIYFSSDDPGSVVEFRLRGRSLYLSYWKLNDDMGTVAVSVDGREPVKLDGWCADTWGGSRASQLLWNGDACEEHQVRVELLDEKNEASEGHAFRILGLSAAGVVDTNRTVNPGG